VEYISSGGLRVVLMLSRMLAKTNSKLKLCGLNPFVAEVFEISRFSALFEIYPNRDAAVSAFRIDVPEG
jgi:anti-anti-sigma factor